MLPGSTQPKPQDEAARKKKTDEPTPDDPQEQPGDKPAADTTEASQEEKSFVAEADDELKVSLNRKLDNLIWE